MMPPNDDPRNGSTVTDDLRSWVMLALTAAFVILYGVALFIATINNDRMARLEAIVGVIIGYYFGRVPGEKNERALKQEIDRQAGKVKEAEEKKEQAHEEKSAAREAAAALDQKLKSARAALSAGGPQLTAAAAAAHEDNHVEPGAIALQHSVAAAIRALDA